MIYTEMEPNTRASVTAGSEAQRYANPVPSLKRILGFFIFCAMVGSALVPRVRTGDVSIGADDVLSFLVGCLLPFYLLSLFTDKGIRAVMITWCVVIASGIVFSLLASFNILGHYEFPTEMWQYVKRMVFFLAAYVLVRSGIISVRAGVLSLLLCLLLAGVTGPLQSSGSSIGASLADLYARTDRQYLALIQRGYQVQRAFGIAGHSIAWGGFAAFSAVVGLALFLASGRTINSARGLLGGIIVLIGIFNVLLSGSKAALIACFGGVVFTVALAFAKWRLKGRFWAKCAIMGIGAAIVLTPVVIARYDFLAMRLEEGYEDLEVGSGRLDMAYASLSLLDSPADWLIGVSNSVQRMVISFGTEVEPVYLLVNYGILGVLLRYGLMLLILRPILKFYLQTGNGVALACVAGMAVYLVFSCGYFFFQEIVVGTTPWLLFGLSFAQAQNALRPNASPALLPQNLRICPNTKF